MDQRRQWEGALLERRRDWTRSDWTRLELDSWAVKVECQMLGRVSKSDREFIPDSYTGEPTRGARR